MRTTQRMAGTILAVVFTVVGTTALDAQTREKTGGPPEGIRVRGQWTIEIRNPDGTLAARREFENALDLIVLTGWVDLHAHPTSTLAFGGTLFHGASSVESPMPAMQMPGDPECRFDQCGTSIAEALSQNGPTRGDPLQSRSGDAVGNTLIKAIESFNGAVTAPAGTDGFAAFTHWPKWYDITHHTVWIDWVRRAWEGGQRAMIARSHNNRSLGAPEIRWTDQRRSRRSRIVRLADRGDRPPDVAQGRYPESIDSVAGRRRLWTSE